MNIVGLSSKAKIIKCEFGEIIQREGTLPKGLYILKRGRCNACSIKLKVTNMRSPRTSWSHAIKLRKPSSSQEEETFIGGIIPHSNPVTSHKVYQNECVELRTEYEGQHIIYKDLVRNWVKSDGILEINGIGSLRRENFKPASVSQR